MYQSVSCWAAGNACFVGPPPETEAGQASVSAASHGSREIATAPPSILGKGLRIGPCATYIMNSPLAERRQRRSNRRILVQAPMSTRLALTSHLATHDQWSGPRWRTITPTTRASAAGTQEIRGGGGSVGLVTG